MRNLLILLVAVTFIYSCGKENITSENSTPTEINNTTTSRNLSVEQLAEGIDQKDGMLVFKNEEQLQSVVEGLTKLADDHDDSFVAKYKELSIDELEEVEESIGHEEFQPLIDFERILDFRSRRSVIDEIITDFLQAEEPDWKNNPEFIDGHSQALRSILNKDEKLMIGEKVVDYNFKAPPADDCWEWGVEWDRGYYRDNSRRWNIEVRAHKLGSWSIVKCKVCNYRKRNNGRWARKRVDMRVRIAGTVRDEKCDQVATLDSGYETKRKSCWSRYERDFGWGERRFMDDEVCGSAYFRDYPEVNKELCIVLY